MWVIFFVGICLLSGGEGEVEVAPGICRDSIPGCGSYRYFPQDFDSSSGNADDEEALDVVDYECEECENGWELVDGLCVDCAYELCSIFERNSCLCSVCAEGLLNEEKTLCCPEIGSCLSYGDACDCTSCDGENIIVNSGDLCCAEQFGCDVYATDCSCYGCHSGYDFTGGSCVLRCEAIENCVDYSSDCTMCMECKLGFDPFGSKCCKAIYGCGDYTEDCSLCNACADGFVNVASALDESVVCADVIDKCTKYTQSEDTGKYECSACENGYQLVDGECDPCSKISNCKAYDSECRCTTCTSEDYVVTHEGEHCCAGVPNCKEYGQDCVCTECEAGFSYSSAHDVCLKDECGVDVVCREYSGCTCTSCPLGYAIWDGASVCTECINVCESFERDSCGCISCPPDRTLVLHHGTGLSVCAISTSIPKYCSVINEEPKCLSCKRGYKLSADSSTCTAIASIDCPNCQQGFCNSARGTCSKCKDGFTLVTVESDLQVCVPAGNTEGSLCLSVDCSVCAPGYGTDGSACSPCPDNSFSYGTSSCQQLTNGMNIYGFNYRSETCATFDPLFGGCRTCKEGTFLTAGFTCDDCPASTFVSLPDHPNPKCFDCNFAEGCITCDSKDGHCTGCDTDRYDYQENFTCTRGLIDNCRVYTSDQESEEELVSNDEYVYGCAVCDNGFMLTERKLCRKCDEIERCLIYGDACDCRLCSPGSIITNGGYSCCKTINNCEKYNAECECAQCKDDYQVNLNKCVLSCDVIEHCLDYNTNCTCLDCGDGYDPSGKKCCKEISGCGLYTDDCNDCIRCDSGFAPVESLSVGVKCAPEIIGCTSYAKSQDSTYLCTQCKSGYYLEDGFCQQCEKIEHCSIYDPQCKCTSCEGTDETYVPHQDGSMCCTETPECTEYDSECNCVLCAAGFSLDGKTGACKKNSCSEGICKEYARDGCSCVSCPQGYSIGDGACVECKNMCETYAPDKCQCLTCPSGHTLVMNQYLDYDVCLVTSSIINGCKIVGVDDKCLFCGRGMKLLEGMCVSRQDIVCRNCQPGKCSYGNCSSCVEGYSLVHVESGATVCIPTTNAQDDLCLAKDSIGTCTACPVGYSPDETTCHLCTGGSHSDGTTVCKPYGENLAGISFKANTCASVDPIFGGCMDCINGTYITDAFTCEVCPSGTYNPKTNNKQKSCIACTLPEACTECHKVHGHCVSCYAERYEYQQMDYSCIPKVDNNTRNIILLVVVVVVGVLIFAALVLWFARIIYLNYQASKDYDYGSEEEEYESYTGSESYTESGESEYSGQSASGSQVSDEYTSSISDSSTTTETSSIAHDPTQIAKILGERGAKYSETETTSLIHTMETESETEEESESTTVSAARSSTTEGSEESAHGTETTTSSGIRDVSSSAVSSETSADVSGTELTSSSTTEEVYLGSSSSS